MPEKTRIRPPIIELASTRTKEFLREKEAMFWVFGFPLILALALGFAFREKPPDRVPVGVVAGPEAQQRAVALAKSPALLPRIVTPEEGRDLLRHGKISLLIEGSNPVVYRLDPTRPESRSAQTKADDCV